MSRRFAELDWQQTPIGEISLRRRTEPSLGVDVFEVRLGDEYLMSSLFTVAEVELSRLALAAVDGEQLDVAVGGLGLGYTARAALDDERVRSVHVVEALDAVIDWHRRELLPLSPELNADPRLHYLAGDFFALVRAGEGLGGALPQRWHAIVVDIDHSPVHHLDGGHADFYSVDGLRRIAELLHPGGVFALWSDDPPDEDYLDKLRRVFRHAAGHLVGFDNPLTGGTSTNGVYVAST